MVARTVIRMGHPTLRLVAQFVTKEEFETQEFKNLLTDLYDTMKKEGGIGIAAPQINVSKSVTIIELPEYSERYGKLPVTRPITIINPKIKFLTEEKQGFYEGCLSVPGLRGFVERPKKIEVEFYDHNFDRQKIVVEDFLATVFQHELDHLFGKLYIDRMSDTTKLTYLAEYDEFFASKNEHHEID